MAFLLHRGAGVAHLLMASRRTILYVDGTGRTLLDSPASKQTRTLPEFRTGEKIIVDVVPLQEIEGGTNPAWEPDDSYASSTFKMGIGLVDAVPTEGDGKVTYNGGTGTALAFDAAASVVEANLNAIAQVTSDGGVTVTGTAATGYRIRFVTVGAKSDFGGDEYNFLPESTFAFSLEREGTATIKEVVKMRAVQKQAGLTTAASNIPAGSMSVETFVAGSKASREVTDITCIAATTATAQKEEFTAVAVGGVYQVQSLTTTAATSLDGKYFTLQDDEGSVAFWYDLTGSTTIPAAAEAADRSVEITTLTTSASDGTVAALTATAIAADSKFSTTHDGNVVLATASTLGNHGTVLAGDSGFTVANSVTGAETDAYDGTYFTLAKRNSDGSETTLGFWYSATGTTDPPAGALSLDADLVEITGYNLYGTAQHMASVTSTAITSAGLPSVVSGTEVHMTQTNAGTVTSGLSRDSPLTSFTVVTAGAAANLDGTHFLLWETDGVGGEKSRAFWMNVDGETAPAGTALTADYTTEITTILAGHKAHEVAGVVATAIDALSGYTATVNGDKVHVESSIGYNFTASTAETSGFTVAATSNGGTGSDTSASVAIKFSDQAMGGAYVLGVDLGDGVAQSGGIAWNASTTEISETLSAMTGITEDDIFLEGGVGGDVRLSFRGALAAQAITVTVDDSSLIWVSGKRFTLNLQTTAAESLMYGLDTLDVVFELEATTGSDSAVKLIYAPATLVNGLIDPAATAPSPLLSYYTQDEVDNLVIHHRKDISSLAGGTSVDLDSIVTASTITPPRTVFFYDADELEWVFYVLKEGTQAEAAPTYIRPDDYATTTNEVYWEKVTLGGQVNSVIGGTDITVDATDPVNPTINYSGSGGGYVSPIAITGLTGGTASDLDSVATTSLSVSDLHSVVTTEGVVELVYRLDSGTDAEDAPWIVRPDDYHATTNTRVWRLISPCQTTTFEFLGTADNHTVTTEHGYYTSGYVKTLELQVDFFALPSGSGSGSVGWNVHMGGNACLDSTVTQTALTTRAIADEAGTLNAFGTQAPKVLIEVDITDVGGATAGKGLVLHHRHLWSPINS